MCIGCGCPTHPTSSAITTGWRRTSLRTSGFNANIAITTLIFAITTTRFNSVILSTDHDVLTPKALQHLAELHHKVKQFPKCPPKYPLKIASFREAVSREKKRFFVKLFCKRVGGCLTDFIPLFYFSKPPTPFFSLKKWTTKNDGFP